MFGSCPFLSVIYIPLVRRAKGGGSLRRLMGPVYSFVGSFTVVRQGEELMGEIAIFVVGCIVTLICGAAIAFLLWGAYLDGKPPD